MQRPNAAARRFFRAYYQWIILTRPTEQRPLPLRASCWKAFHGSASGGNSVVRNVVSRHYRGLSGDVRNDSDAGKPTIKYSHDPELVRSPAPESFIHGPVQTAVDRPFDTISPKMPVVRHRSSSAIMIEAAVPEQPLGQLKLRYGMQLEELNKSTGARLEVQNISQPLQGDASGQRAVSVLLSGTFDRVHRAWNAIRGQINHPPTESKVDVKVMRSRPSDALLPFEYSIRRSSDADMQVELSVPEAPWMAYVTVNDIDKLKAKRAVKIHIGEPAQRPSDAESGGTELARSIFISGRRGDVSSVLDRLRAAVKRTSTPSPASPVEAQQTKSRGTTDQRFDKTGPQSQPQAATIVYSCSIKLHRYRWPEVMAIVIGEEGGRLRDIKNQTGCADVWQSDAGMLRARGTLAELGRFQDAVQRKVARAYKELQLPPTELDIQYKEEDYIKHVNFGSSETNLEILRPAFRTLTHPVALVTARSRKQNTQLDTTTNMITSRGVTVSSLATVAMEPTPVVSFNLKVPSSSWDAIRWDGLMRIHLLRASQRGAMIAHVFTQPHAEAHGGFLQLDKLRVPVEHPVRYRSGEPKRYKPRLLPPLVGDAQSVVASLALRLLPRKCVEVGDHVIVVAEVLTCQLHGVTEPNDQKLDDKVGLSYAKRAYRDRGHEIEPDAQAMDELDPLALGTESDGTQPRSAPGSGETPRWQSGDSIPEPVGDPVYDILRATRDAEDGKKVDLFDLMSRDAQSEEDEHDLGFADPHQSAPSPGQTRHSTGSTAGETTARREVPLWDSDDVAREESQRLAVNEMPRSSPVNRKRSAVSVPWAIKRQYSTLAKPEHSTGTTSGPGTESAVGMMQTDIAELVEPSAKNTIVADYLGVPDDGTPMRTHRVRSLIRMNKDARWAERRLLEDAEHLPEEEIVKLQRQVNVNDRKVAKKLAWNAVDDLRLMLDKGRVDFKRAQFFESAIEKGQAVLLEEAKYVRQMLEQGKLDKAVFDQWKAKLEHEHAVLTTETNRLRQFVEEGENVEDD